MYVSSPIKHRLVFSIFGPIGTIVKLFILSMRYLSSRAIKKKKKQKKERKKNFKRR